MKKHINITKIIQTLCLSALPLVAQGTTLQDLTASINQSIGNNLDSFISQLSITMQDENIVILNSATGQEYYLDTEEVLEFNRLYGIELDQSTAEYLINKYIDNKIDNLQSDFYSQKEVLLEQAEQIAAVTAIAEELSSANESKKIALNDYAVTNSLTGIEENTVQMFNTTIDEMVSTSRTANMLELYRGAIVESVSYITHATETAQSFFDAASTAASEYDNSLTVEWDTQTISVEDEFWGYSDGQNFYGSEDNLSENEYES